MIEEEQIIAFQVILLDWYEQNKRSFPWRYTFNPYFVFVSELLLQQTDAKKVIDPYKRIIKEYPHIQSLSEAEYENVKNIFKKIGLFYRANRLICISKQVMKEFNGNIPADLEELLSISGIGRYTANAILCFGYSLPFAIVDTNIIRIYNRFFGIKSNILRAREDKRMWDFAQYMLPEEDYVDFNYALLDFGALVCRSKVNNCSTCVLNCCCLKDI